MGKSLWLVALSPIENNRLKTNTYIKPLSGRICLDAPWRIRAAARRRLNHATPRRKDDAKFAACAQLGLDFECRLMAQQHMFDNGEPQSGTARFARTPTIDAVKTFGEPRNMLGSDAD